MATRRSSKDENASPVARVVEKLTRGFRSAWPIAEAYRAALDSALGSFAPFRVEAPAFVLEELRITPLPSPSTDAVAFRDALVAAFASVPAPEHVVRPSVLSPIASVTLPDGGATFEGVVLCVADGVAEECRYYRTPDTSAKGAPFRVPR